MNTFGIPTTPVLGVFSLRDLDEIITYAQDNGLKPQKWAMFDPTYEVKEVLGCPVESALLLNIYLGQHRIGSLMGANTILLVCDRHYGVLVSMYELNTRREIVILQPQAYVIIGKA